MCVIDVKWSFGRKVASDVSSCSIRILKVLCRNSSVRAALLKPQEFCFFFCIYFSWGIKYCNWQNRLMDLCTGTVYIEIELGLSQTVAMKLEKLQNTKTLLSALDSSQLDLRSHKMQNSKRPTKVILDILCYLSCRSTLRSMPSILGHSSGRAAARVFV